MSPLRASLPPASASGGQPSSKEFQEGMNEFFYSFMTRQNNALNETLSRISTPPPKDEDDDDDDFDDD